MMKSVPLVALNNSCICFSKLKLWELKMLICRIFILNNCYYDPTRIKATLTTYSIRISIQQKNKIK